MDVFTGSPTFPYLPTLLQLALTLALGLFVRPGRWLCERAEVP
jgi:hypothetical protein